MAKLTRKKSDGGAWATVPQPLGVSDPVTVNFDDPVIGTTGVQIPYPAGAYPIYLLIDVVVASDGSGSYGLLAQNGDSLESVWRKCGSR